MRALNINIFSLSSTHAAIPVLEKLIEKLGKNITIFEARDKEDQMTYHHDTDAAKESDRIGLGWVLSLGEITVPWSDVTRKRGAKAKEGVIIEVYSCD